MNKMNAVLMLILYLNGVILFQQQIWMNIKRKYAEDLVNTVLINYHLTVSVIDVTIIVLVIVELFKIVLIKKLMELGIHQYVKMLLRK